jgi:hypothetical protein
LGTDRNGTNVDPDADDMDVEGHRLSSNDNETVVDVSDEDDDIEGHRLAANDNETVVHGAADGDEDVQAASAEPDPKPAP